MEIPQIYAILVGAIFLLLLLSSSLAFFCRNIRVLVHCLHRAFRLLGKSLQTLSKNTTFQLFQTLVYPQVVGRHRHVGPWRPIDLITPALYLSINLFCVIFRATSVQAAGLRAANLSIINAIPLFSGPHLGFLADILGMSVSSYRLIHRWAAIMVVLLLVIHCFAAIAGGESFSLRTAGNIWAVVAASTLPATLVLSHPLLRKPSYELFLRTHFALGCLSVYSMWRHLPLELLFPRVYLYGSLSVFCFSALVHFVLIVYRSGARSSLAGISHSNGLVKVIIKLPRRSSLHTEPGQYISLWIPTISFWSFAQLHPFTIASWSEGSQDELVLYIEPKNGLTRNLLEFSERPGNSTCLALFTGPHGTTAPVTDYESVIMVASGLGITTQLPYLQKLVYNGKSEVLRTRTRRVHLVWRLESIEMAIEMEPLLNEALKADDNRVLAISVYITSGVFEMVFGEGGKVLCGFPDLDQIIKRENDIKEDGKMLVLLSGNGELRDQARLAVRKCSDGNTRCWDLEFQPESER